MADPLAGVEYLWIDLSPAADRRVFIDTDARGPPEGAVSLVLMQGGESIPASVSADGTKLYIPAAQVPAARRSLDDLVWLAKAVPAGRVRELLRRPEADRTVPLEASTDAATRPLIAHLEAGEPRKAAALLVSDPAEARRQLDADRDLVCVNADRFLKLDRGGEALEVIATAMRLHGDHPRLLLLKGLAEISRGRTEGARETLTNMGRVSEPQPLLTELYRRLKGNPPPAEKRYLRTASRVIAARELTGEHAGVDIEAILDNSGVLAVQMTFDTPTFMSVGMERLDAGTAAYIDDSAGLSNLDLAPNPLASLRESIAGGGYELLELYDPALAVLPEVLRFGGTPGDIPKGTQQQSRARRAPWSVPAAFPTYTYSLAPIDDDDNNESVEVVVVGGTEEGKAHPDAARSRVLIVRKKAVR